MDNPEKLPPFGTQDTVGDKQSTTQKTKKMSVMKHWLYPRVQMVHQKSKIFYRSGAGKLKKCQWWNTDYTLGYKWFTRRVKYSTGVEQEN